MRLGPETLDRLPAEVARPEYDRSAQRTGIVHFGLGAFHRAHQAWYTDACMNAGERDWAISGVSLRSAAVAEQLNPQDGLYTLTERGAGAEGTRLIGAVREVIVANSSPHVLAIQLIAPDTRLVTITVTEKGYCRTPEGSLDYKLARGNSIYSHLAGTLRERMRAGMTGLTLLSCDNLSGNGEVLQRLMAEYLATEAPDTLAWFEAECACPNSMVDRIVPATTPADIDALEARTGLRDEAAVFTEPFSQWVIEERFAAGRPGWEKHGAQLVEDVAPYETAKLRMLNGAHSALAYLGLERGHTFVHEAVADSELRRLVERLMRVEAAGSFTPAAEQNLEAYADELLARFANSALQHRLIQIAMDGSEKIPQRWLETVAARRAKGAECLSILTALAAWLRHVRGDARPVDDPRAAGLADLWRAQGTSGIAAAVLGEGGLLGPSLSEAEIRQVAELL